MAAQVGGDDPEMTPERREDLSPNSARPCTVTPWISMTVCAPGGPAHSHTRVVPRPGSSTSRVRGIAASLSIRRFSFSLAPRAQIAPGQAGRHTASRTA